MATPYCPSCDALTTKEDGQCQECGTECPVEGWPNDDLIGQPFLETYTVIGRLGSGGFGVVYLAENAEFGARRAIKVLDARHLHNDAILRRFRREAKALYKLQSPYTVRVERWGRTDEGHYYLVMELAEGETLRQLLEREGTLDERRALSIIRQTAVALADAHELGIVHRDLKPENLVIREHPHEGDRVAVLDFGISKILGDDSATHRSGLVGTPSYMAPECWNPALGPQDIRADLWSLGVMFFEILVGVLPFEGDRGSPDPMTTAFRIANLETEQLTETLDLDSVHSQTRKVVLGLLTRDPAERYQSPDELLADIDRHPLWATGVRRASRSAAPRKAPKRAATVRPARLETADTVPDLPSSVDGAEKEQTSTPDDDLFAFQDEPPEGLRIRTTDEDPSDYEVRRGPSIWPIIVALVVLGLFWVGTRYGGKILGIITANDADTGVVAENDASVDEPDTSQPLGLPHTSTGLDGTRAVLVPGGAFEMGFDAPASLIPAHTVILDPYYVDENEVTAGQWRECVRRGGCPAELALTSADNEACRHLDGSAADSELALNCVSWFAADHYCRAFGRRLPTEAEWERAASLEAERIALADGRDSDFDEEEESRPIARALNNGLREWVSDWYSTDYYDVSPVMNPTGSIFGTTRVVRGGGADDRNPTWTQRDQAEPDLRDPGLGFRCAQSASLPSRPGAD